MKGLRYIPPNQFQSLAGATVTSTAGVGPCYFSAPYEYDSQVTATTAAGLGYTLFANVPVNAGTVDATITLSGTTCVSNSNIANGPAPNTVRLPLKAGFQTVLEVLCE